MTELKIGRAEDCTIIISDPSVSRLHAYFIIDGNTYSIRDNNSTNGTYVNGQRITGTRVLTPNDILKVGDTVLPWKKYIPAGAAPAAAPAPVVQSPPPTTIPESKKRRTPAMVVMLITGIAAIFIALLAFFFIRSGDEERRMEGNWNCSAGCGSLKTISFSMKGKPYELSYTRAQAGAADEIIRGNWVMNIKDSVLTLTPSLPGGTDTLSAGATATYKYSMIKNTLTLTRQGSNTATVNPVIFVKD